jgi:hypothetical protein
MKRAGWKTATLKTALVLVAGTGGLLLSFLLTEIHEDRAYRLIITGTVNVYSQPELPDKDHPNSILTVLGPPDEVEVRRIDREGGWVRVRLRDHREGYIFLNSKINLRRD